MDCSPGGQANPSPDSGYPSARNHFRGSGAYRGVRHPGPRRPGMQIRVLVAEHVRMGLHNAAEADPVRDRVHLRNREPLGYALRSMLSVRERSFLHHHAERGLCLRRLRRAMALPLTPHLGECRVYEQEDMGMGSRSGLR